MMKNKITLLILLLTICFPVYAKDSYTDYTLIGYTNEKSEDSELYKFEPLKLHNFYRLTEIGTKYLEDSTPIDGDQVDLNDTKEEMTLSQFKPKDNTTFTTHILLRGEDNYISKKLILKNAKSLLDSGAKFKVYYGNRVQTETAEVVPETEDIIFVLGRSCALGGIRLEIDYTIDEPITINFNLLNTTGTSIDQAITLDPEIKKVTLTPTIFYNYEKFLEDNSFVGDKYVIYYEYLRKLYKHYYSVKDDYIKSFKDSIDGYEYDPEEDEVVYAIYRREKIVESDEKVQGNINNDSTEEQPITQIPVENEGVPTLVKTPTYSKKPIIKKNIEDKELGSNETLIPVSKTEKTMENTETEPDQVEEGEYCEENKRPIILKRVGVSLLLISLVSFIIHCVCVKYRDEND